MTRQWKILDTHTGLAIVGFAYANAVYWSSREKIFKRGAFRPSSHKEAT